MLKIKKVTKLGLVILTLTATTLVAKSVFLSNQTESEGPSFSLQFLSSQPTVLTTHWTCWNPDAPEKFSKIRFVKDADSFTGLAWFADSTGQETGQATFMVREAQEKNESLETAADQQKQEDSRRHFYGESQNFLKVSELNLRTQTNENLKIQVDEKALHSRSKQGKILVSFQDPKSSEGQFSYDCRKFSETRSLPTDQSFESKVARF